MFQLHPESEHAQPEGCRADAQVLGQPPATVDPGAAVSGVVRKHLLASLGIESREACREAPVNRLVVMHRFGCRRLHVDGGGTWAPLGLEQDEPCDAPCVRPEVLDVRALVQPARQAIQDLVGQHVGVGPPTHLEVAAHEPPQRFVRLTGILASGAEAVEQATERDVRLRPR